MFTHPKQPKKTTASDKPRFSGPEPGFGPDAVIFGCFGRGLNQKCFRVNALQNKQQRPPHLPNPGFPAQNLGLGQMWSFWVVLRRVYTKSFHIWPKPTVDVATINVNTLQNNQQRPHLAQSQVFGPRTWVWARCGHLGLFWKGGLSSLPFLFCL